jgi:chaperonin GroES
LDKDKKPISWLIKNIDKDNIADDIDDTVLENIASRVVAGYDIDLASRTEWEDKTNYGLDIARQKIEAKNTPWEGAANIKYPLIATASIQFAARAYPQIVKGPDIVKCEIIGKNSILKEERSKRVGQHMSYQLLTEMEEWDQDTDQLLTSLPVVGMYFRKSYRDPILKRNKSVRISPMDFVVNQDIKDLVTCRRMTEKVWLYKNDVIERERLGLFTEDVSDVMEQNDDEDIKELFLEQHMWYDLDNDGYAEPYIATVHHDSKKLCRIVARYDDVGIKERNGKIWRIEPVQYYTDYGFLPDPAGGYYMLGFAHLLGPINETINTVINQLLDSGTLANRSGGFVAQGLNMKGGVLKFKPFEWKTIETTGASLKDNLVPLPVREPSNVLFQLLGLLTETGMKLAAVSETMTGEVPGQNTPATTVLAMIEQGLKVFTSIYKRIFRSLKSEYKKLYRLNSIYMDEIEYINVLDDEMAIFKTDYGQKDLDIVPTADPTISSEAQRLARAQAMLNSLQMNSTKSGKIEILKYYYDAIGVPDVNRFLPEKEVQSLLTDQAPPDPNLIKAQADIITAQSKADSESKRLLIEQIKTEAEVELLLAQVEELKTRAIKNVADAESKEPGSQLDMYKAQIASIKMQHDFEMANKKAAEPQGESNATGDNGANESGGAGSVEQPSDNGQNPESMGEGGGSVPSGDMQGGDLESQLSGANGAPDLNAVGQGLLNRANTGGEEVTAGREEGGTVKKGQTVWVGEKGPEKIKAKQDIEVIPMQYAKAWGISPELLEKYWPILRNVKPENRRDLLYFNMTIDEAKYNKPDPIVTVAPYNINETVKPMIPKLSEQDIRGIESAQPNQREGIKKLWEEETGG